MLPKVIERGVTVDFAFIDGMHTFDYTLIDLFFCDKLLRPGGIMCVHDMNLPGKKRALSYLMKYCSSRECEEAVYRESWICLEGSVEIRPKRELEFHDYDRADADNEKDFVLRAGLGFLCTNLKVILLRRKDGSTPASFLITLHSARYCQSGECRQCTPLSIPAQESRWRSHQLHRADRCR